MLRIYTALKHVKGEHKYVESNDAFFGVITSGEELTEYDYSVIEEIDHAKIIKVEGVKSKSFETPFGIIGTNKLSTGCKTLINIEHHPENVYNLLECGWNCQKLLSARHSKSDIEVRGLYPEERFELSDGAEVVLNDKYSIVDPAEYMDKVYKEMKA